MDIETFNKGFKIFNRFIKDEGMYTPIRNFMFKKKRKPINLFEEFNSKTYMDVDNWEVVFEKINLLSGYLWNFDFDEYNKLIANTKLSRKWKEYFIENYK